MARLLESFDSPQVHYRIFPKTPLSRLPMRNLEAEEAVQPLVEPQIVAPVEPVVAVPPPVTVPVQPAARDVLDARPPAPVYPPFNRAPAPRDVMGVAPAAPAEAPVYAPPPRRQEIPAPVAAAPVAPAPVAPAPVAAAPITKPSIMDLPGRAQDPSVLSQRASMGPQMPVLGMYHRAPAVPEAPPAPPEPAYQPHAESRAEPPPVAPEPQYRPRPVTGGADLRDVFRKLK